MPLSDERGFSLVELLVTALIGVFVVGVIGTVLIGALNGTARVTDRQEAVQSGRIAMEQLTQRIRSQTCFGTGRPAMTEARDDSMTFYANLGDDYPAFQPQRRRLRVTNGAIWEDVWHGTGTWPNVVYAAQPTSSRQIASRVAPVPGQPWFRYYAFTDADPITPSQVLPTPLSAANLARAVQIEVNFRSLPPSGRTHPQNISEATFQTYVYIRTADPTDPVHSPQCI